MGFQLQEAQINCLYAFSLRLVDWVRWFFFDESKSTLNPTIGVVNVTVPLEVILTFYFKIFYGDQWKEFIAKMVGSL